MNAPRAKPATEAAAKRALMSEIIWAVPRTYFRLTRVAERLFGEYDLTAGQLAILRDLATIGPSTISQMARSRPVARQYIQRLVAGLVSAGLAELVPNPEDRRSKLARLLPPGRRLVERVAAREAEALEHLVAELDLRSLEAARDVVVWLRDRLAEDDLLDDFAGKETG